MWIEITEHDVLLADRSVNILHHAEVCECCPVAQAMKRAMPGQRVRVSPDWILVGGEYRFKVSKRLRGQILLWDDNKGFAPGGYHVDELVTSSTP